MPFDDRSTRKHLHHDVPQWVEEGALFFITVNCKERGGTQLTLPEIATGLLEAARFYHDRRKWQVPLFLLMPDHWHAILAFPGAVVMADALRDWKRFTSRQFGIAWQDGFFDHRLRDAKEAQAKHDYIRHNPVRQGLCPRTEDWPHQARATQDGCEIGAW
jgi:REP element-mobilizing transposase RayT